MMTETPAVENRSAAELLIAVKEERRLLESDIIKLNSEIESFKKENKKLKQDIKSLGQKVKQIAKEEIYLVKENEKLKRIEPKNDKEKEALKLKKQIIKERSRQLNLDQKYVKQEQLVLEEKAQALYEKGSILDGEKAMLDAQKNDLDQKIKKLNWEAKKFKRKFADIIKFDSWKAWLYLVPTLILLVIFTFWPLINTVKMAFTVYWDAEAPVYELDENGNPITDDDTGMLKIKSWGKWKGYNIALDQAGETDFQFGIHNFINVIKYDGFVRIMQNTIILCVATVPLSTFLALLIAVCLNSIKPLRRFLQTIFFMPYVTNSIAIGMVFAAMFNIVGVNEHNLDLSRSLGIINNIIGVFGVGPINWVNQGSGYWANIAVMIIYIVWNALPFKILILLGGLQSVNKQYYEAAKIDATPAWRVFTKITVPLLSPMIAYVVITGFIGGFKEYTSIVGIFGEGMQPPGAGAGTPRLQTMVGFIYEALETNSQGMASAAAIILFLLIFAVTLVNLYVSKKKTHY